MTALASAREAMASQSQQLAGAQSKVDELLNIQQKLRGILTGDGEADAGGIAALGRSASMAVGGDAAAKAPAGEDLTAKLSELRQMLGKAVQVQAQQQIEIDGLKDQLRDQKTASEVAVANAVSSSSELKDMQKHMDELREELETEKRERMESEASALEREEALQEEVDDLKEAERRRLELMKKMEEVEAMSAPPAPAASIAVKAPPPPAVPQGFEAAAGGFEL